MNLGDPELELIDPTPNVHSLFVHFDKTFFWEKLSSRTAVRWSKRMYSCAGTCSYGGKYGMCDIALSEPLLKLRPRKDLVETLLHEMIHAYLFILNQDRDRDGHGLNFRKHMHRINRSTGLNISIYHSFHDEVDLYRTHWWRCDGPCQYKKPYFGVVRRSSNRAPGPSDYWWENHKRFCNGNFIKIKGPNVTVKKSTKKQKNDATNNPNIQDYFVKSVSKPQNDKMPQSNIVTSTPKGHIQTPSPVIEPVLFSGQGQKLGGKAVRTVTNITETVRKIWADKEFQTITKSTQKANDKENQGKKLRDVSKRTKTVISKTPVKKIKKIDDFFQTPEKVEFHPDNCLRNKKDELVLCPICNKIYNYEHINNHLDECLNTQAIIDLTRNDFEHPADKTDYIPTSSNKIDINSKGNKQDYNNQHSTSHNDIELISLVESDDSLHNVSDIHNNNQTVLNKGETRDNDSETKYAIPEIIPLKTAAPNNDTNVEKLAKHGEECVCCGKKIDIPMADHLEECLSFFSDDSTVPTEATSFASNNKTINLDEDDDMFDETDTHNCTRTKLPCPCCMKMIETAEMNDHLDECLNLGR